MSEPIEPITWWSPEGFRQDMPTPAILAVLNGEEEWGAAMQNAVFDRVYTMSVPEHSASCLEVWQHEDGHLFVDVSERTTFLVAKEHATAFWVTLLPTLEAPHLAFRRAEALELQAKALVAFIRHGHGERTIGEFGNTRDEDLRWQENMRRRAARDKPKA